MPWLPPAGGTAEATTCSSPNPVHAHSRNTASTGSPRARPRPARPASPATRSLGGALRRCGPTAGPRARRGCGGPPRRRRDPRQPWPPPTDRGRTARTTPGRFLRLATPARSPTRRADRPGWRCPPPPSPRDRAIARSGHARFAPPRAAGSPCGAALPRHPARTTETGCAPWARSPRPMPPPSPSGGAADRSPRTAGRARRSRARPRRVWVGSPIKK